MEPLPAPSPDPVPEPLGFISAPTTLHPASPSLLTRVLKKILSTLADPWLWALALCFTLVFLFAFRQNYDFDLGYHLSGGQWILQHLDVPQKDSFTFGAEGHEYLDSQWLYQALVYLLDRLGGYPLLSLFHLALILLAFGLTVYRMSLGGCPRWLQAALILPSVLAMELRFLDRPEVLSWVFLILVLLCLDQYQRGNLGALYFLPVIHLFWANTEALFPLGWVCIAAYLLTLYFTQRRLDRPLGKALLASVVATLVNPYGFQALAFPFLLLTRFDPEGLFKKSISEFQSPWTAKALPDSPFFPAFPVDSYRILAVIFLFLILWTLRRRKFHEYALAFFFFGLSAVAIRNVPLFFLPVLPTVARAAKERLTIRKKGEGEAHPWAPPRVLGLAAVPLIFLLCLRVATGAYYVSERRILHPGLGMDQAHLPLRASVFLKSHHLSGPFLNDLGFGGFLEWEAGVPVFLDGRLEVMGEDLFRRYRQSFGPGGLETLYLQTGFQGVVLDHMTDIPWTRQLLNFTGWRMVYLDDLSAVWVAPNFGQNLPSVTPRDLEKDWGVTPLDEDKTLSDLRALPRFALGEWLNGFIIPQRYPMPCMRLGSLAYEMGDYTAAKDFFMRALVLSEGRYYEVYYNLASAYSKLGQKDRARACYQNLLDLYPTCPGVPALIAGL